MSPTRDGIHIALVAGVLGFLCYYAGPLPALSTVFGGIAVGFIVGWIARGFLSREHKETP